MDALTWLTFPAAVLYGITAFLLAIYGLHSLVLLVLFLRKRKAADALEAAEAARKLPADLPHVLVQLPVFNERDCVDRMLDAVSRLDWPKDRLHIQLLDDSTDDSVLIGRGAVARLAANGFDARHLHRTDRTGFKAGALEAGMQVNDAPFIAIFDADFVPEPDFLRRAIVPMLDDPGIGLVQGRWEHLNRDDNILTRAQAIGIDGHFSVEQGGRAWAGLWLNFNGTCGLWRRQAIIEGGGWEHDTLTEDMDLSYRAQLMGWRCTYRLGMAVPGEIPADINAWRSQQFRWAKGSVQTAKKLLPRVWASNGSLVEKCMASLHMTHYFVHPLILLSLFCAPLALLHIEHGTVPGWLLFAGIGCFLVGAGSPVAMYIASQLSLHGSRGWSRIAHLPVLAAIGTGIAVNNANAVVQAIRGKQSIFVRTPKAGDKGTSSYKAKSATGVPETVCALWAIAGITIGFIGSHTWVTPLLAIYLSGFAWMAGMLIAARRQRTRAQAARTQVVSTLASDSARLATAS